VQGVRLAAVEFSRDVADQVAGAFVKRLRNNLTLEAPLCRWSDEEFLVLHPAAKIEADAAAKQLTKALSGANRGQLGGKTVRPALEVGIAVMDFVPCGGLESTLTKIK
jgi:GGDEF domain-containing protein